MTNHAWQPRALPPGVVGAKVSVYDALIEMAQTSLREVPGGEPGEVYFRKSDLAAKSGISIPHITTCLRWLRSNAFLDYRHGGPGMLSYVKIATEVSSDATPR